MDGDDEGLTLVIERSAEKGESERELFEGPSRIHPGSLKSSYIIHWYEVERIFAIIMLPFSLLYIPVRVCDQILRATSSSNYWNSSEWMMKVLLVCVPVEYR